MIAIPFPWYCTHLIQPVSNTGRYDEVSQGLRETLPQSLSFSSLAVLFRVVLLGLLHMRQGLLRDFARYARHGGLRNSRHR